MKKLLSALLAVIAVFLAYGFAAVSIPAAEGEQPGLGARFAAPFGNLGGTGLVLLALGAVALIGALFLMFSKSRSEKAAAMPSSKFAAKYAMLGRKSKGLEVGFLINGLMALGVLALIVFGTIKGWLDEAAVGALGSVFVLQLLIGVLFLVLFFKKKDKALVPFIPALALFLFEVAVGGFGIVSGLK